MVGFCLFGYYYLRLSPDNKRSYYGSAWDDLLDLCEVSVLKLQAGLGAGHLSSVTRRFGQGTNHFRFIKCT